MTAPVRVLAVADADSYLKWSAATLDRLPASWDRRQTVLASPITPSPAQTRAATGAAIAPVTLRRLHAALRRDPPDVLLLACTGPTVRVLAGLPVVRGARRPVLVTGLPGVSVPASARAARLRRGCDLMVVHSRRERAAFAPLVGTSGPALALSRLPFLSFSSLTQAGAGPAATPGPPAAPGTAVVFAAQAAVPPRRSDREAILLALAEVSAPARAVVKVRALAGERQTHHESLAYADLWADLVRAGRARPDAVTFVAGTMADALAGASSLVTVSSTAALEAMAAGVGVVVLRDFGVGPAMINTVFADSGCLGDLGDVRAGRAFSPDPRWLADNYFHPEGEDELVPALEALVAARRAGRLPERPGPERDREGFRATLRLTLPRPVTRLLGRFGSQRG